MIRGTQYSSTVSSKQEQQNFWGVQQAAQSRSAVNCNIIRTQYPNWQSGRNHHSSAGSPCVQAIIPHFPASQEIFGSKITSISISGKQQHQQLIPPIQDRWARPTSPFCLWRNYVQTPKEWYKYSIASSVILMWWALQECNSSFYFYMTKFWRAYIGSSTKLASYSCGFN